MTFQDYVRLNIRQNTTLFKHTEKMITDTLVYWCWEKLTLRIAFGLEIRQNQIFRKQNLSKPDMSKTEFVKTGFFENKICRNWICQKRNSSKSNFSKTEFNEFWFGDKCQFPQGTELTNHAIINNESFHAFSMAIGTCYFVEPGST